MQEQKEKINSYTDLVVWQKAIDLVVEVYNLTDKFPKSELFGLTSQMRRAAVSIPSNIAEGRRRGSRKDFCHFLITAYGSGGELETQVVIAKKLKYTRAEDYLKIDLLLSEVMRMLNVMIKKLQATNLQATS
jgi:four helix bundle protein